MFILLLVMSFSVICNAADDDFVIIENYEQNTASTIFSKYPFLRNCFGIICHEPIGIEKMDDTHSENWYTSLYLINSNNAFDFQRQDLRYLANKAFFTESLLRNHKIETLLEYIIGKPQSHEKRTMIEALLSAGAHTKASFTVYQENTTEEHLPPIYYAIIKGNNDAFELLWHAEKNIIMNAAMLQWQTDQPLKKDHTYSITDFLEHMNYISRNSDIYYFKMRLPIPKQKSIQKMIAMIRPSEGSCIIQ